MMPGISTYYAAPERVVETLKPLLDWAKDELQHVSGQWHTFPIFLKATAGMRELPLSQRFAIIQVRRGRESGRGGVCKVHHTAGLFVQEGARQEYISPVPIS